MYIPPHTEKIIGGDKDSHGCLIAAGYNWSALKNNCIRVWDSGLRVNFIKNANNSKQQMVISSFLVFNADSSAIEVFTSKETKKNIILFKNYSSQKWINKKDPFIWVTHQKGRWQLFITNSATKETCELEN